MLIKEQLQNLSKEKKTNEYVVSREFLQLLLLKELYSNSFSEDIYFKGGTCIRLVYGGSRFSEDLDFTVDMEEEEFEKNINKFFKQISGSYPIKFKEKEAIAGKTYLATITTDFLKQEIYIKLDFSFREKPLEPVKKIVKDLDYPIIFKNFVNCLSLDEIFAEKVRAFLSREKARDLYDLWILLELGAKYREELIAKKVSYYNVEYRKEDVLERIKTLSKGNFVTELRPFVPIGEREGLGELFEYICEYLKKI
jgi:predicted nucleotidyltransferase component of viral defense system